MAPHPCCRDLAAWPEFDVVPSPDMGAQLNLAPQLGAASKEGKGGIGLGVRKEEAPQPQHHGCQEHEGGDDSGSFFSITSWRYAVHI